MLAAKYTFNTCNLYNINIFNIKMIIWNCHLIQVLLSPKLATLFMDLQAYAQDRLIYCKWCWSRKY